MSRLKLITKYFVRNALEEGFGGKKSKSWILIALGIIFIMACFSAPFITMVLAAYDGFKALGQEGYLISLVLTSGSMVVLFFGIFTILNVFCFSDDVEQVLPLPFKSSEVIFGKFMALMIQIYMYGLIIVFPLIAYGIASKAGIIFYLYLLIAFLIIPIMPTVIGTILCMIFMKFTNLSKHKDAFRMFSGVLMLVLVVAFNIYTQNSKGMESEESIKALINQGDNSLMSAIGNVFFTVQLCAKGLLYASEFKGFEYIAAALIISLCLFGIFYIIGGNIYNKSIMGGLETYSKREDILESNKADKFVKTNSQVKALVFKDLKVMIRTPQFFLNSIAILIYMPAIFGVAFFSGGALSDIQKNFFQDSSLYGYILAGIFGFSLLTVCGGGAALTAVSREGKDFMVSKYIPVSPKDHLKSKIILSLAVNEFVALILVIIMAVIKMPLGLFILSAIVSILSVGVVAIAELYLDYRSPKLEWDSERDIFKKNFLPLIIMVLAFLFAGITAGLNFIVKNYIIVFLAITVIMSALIPLFYTKLVKAAYKLYEEV